MLLGPSFSYLNKAVVAGQSLQLVRPMFDKAGTAKRGVCAGDCMRDIEVALSKVFSGCNQRVYEK